MTAAEPGPDPLGGHVDTTRASIARVYDYALGGTNNDEIDRATIEQIRRVAPEVELLAVDNRAFLIRALRVVAECGEVSQFLDCGSGLPTAKNTHQVVGRLLPDARVVYVDNDPSVITLGRELLGDSGNAVFAAADIVRPGEVLTHPTVVGHLDLGRPVVLIQNGTLHHYDDPARSPQDIMAEYVGALPSGSFVVLAHFFDPEDDDSALARRLEEMFVHSPMGSGRFRTRAEIAGLFPGLQMLEPGLTVATRWRPDTASDGPLAPAQRCIAGGVGRKP